MKPKFHGINFKKRPRPDADSSIPSKQRSQPTAASADATPAPLPPRQAAILPIGLRLRREKKLLRKTKRKNKKGGDDGGKIESGDDDVSLASSIALSSSDEEEEEGKDDDVNDGQNKKVKLNDLDAQVAALERMMKMIPGMAGVLPGDAMYEGEKKLFAYQEMINVMEPEERKDPKMLLDNPGSDLRWKRIVEESGRSMEEAKTFQREFSNLRLMMTRMSNKLSEKTGFDPSKGKDAVIDESALQELDMRNLAMMSQNRQARRKLEKQARQSGGGDDDAPQKGFGGGGGSGGGGKKKKKR
ncbi:hypothetical protein VYU27_007258 [Nannochloropsis oceanica]